MRIAFIVTSYWSYGELLIAMNFGEEIKASGNEVLFIIPPSLKENVALARHRYVTLIPKVGKLNRILFTEVELKFKPQVIILSDFLNYSFAEKHYGLLPEDLNLFSGKIATFDIYNWCLSRKAMDTYGFRSSLMDKTDIKNFGEKILPCPLIDPSRVKGEGEYCYSLITNLLDTSQKHKKEMRRKYGFGDDRKIIMVPYAKWQESHINHKKVEKFIHLSSRLFDELVIRLSKYYIILVIGKESNKFESYEDIYCYDSMPPEKFDEYAILSDLYIGKNMTSTSMARIAMSGIICVNIINSIIKEENVEEISFGNIHFSDDLKDIYLYKYYMLPVGWYYFLKPLFKDNKYADIICMREQFKMNETMEVIHNLLSSKEKQEEIRHKVSIFNNITKELDKPSEIIKKIIYK